MFILLVEDDNFKKDRILKVLNEAEVKFRYVWASSVKEAVDFLRKNVFDHIILDIALPSHKLRTGGSEALPMPSGGVEIILELSFEGRSDPVSIITQYPEIELEETLVVPIKEAEKEISKWAGVEVRAAILFEFAETEWESKLVQSVRGAV